GNMGDTRGGQVTQVFGIDALVFLDNDLAFAIGNVETGDLAFPALGNEFQLAAVGENVEIIEIEEIRQYGFRRHANGFQQDGDRHLAATVNTEEQDIFGVEFEIEPRATVGNDACREQQFARAVRFTAIVLEE